MPLSPRRRQRALKVQLLRAQGLSLRQIAAHLRVSHTTVRGDLLALETNWPEIAQTAANDIAVHLFRLFSQRLNTLVRDGPLGPFKGSFSQFSDGSMVPTVDILSHTEVIRLHERHDRALHHAAGQLLSAARHLNTADPGRPADWPDQLPPFPLDELADAEQPDPNQPIDAPSEPVQNIPDPAASAQLQSPRPDSDSPQSAPNADPDLSIPPPAHDASAPNLPAPSGEEPADAEHLDPDQPIDAPSEPVQNIPNSAASAQLQPPRPDSDSPQSALNADPDLAIPPPAHDASASNLPAPSGEEPTDAEHLDPDQPIDAPSDPVQNIPNPAASAQLQSPRPDNERAQSAPNADPDLAIPPPAHDVAPPYPESPALSDDELHRRTQERSPELAALIDHIQQPDVLSYTEQELLDALDALDDPSDFFGLPNPPDQPDQLTADAAAPPEVVR